MNADGYSGESRGEGNGMRDAEPRPASSVGSVRIKLFGIGGAGTNAAARLAKEDLGNIDLIGVNTDSQALSSSSLSDTFLVGEKITRGLGSGGDPEVGARVAEAAGPEFDRWMQGADVVFVVAGLGGGTGGPVAQAAGEAATRSGALVIGFAVLPFSFEGPRRQKQAEQSMIGLRKSCDAVIPLPNDILLQEMGDTTPVFEIFQRSDEWIARGVRSIWSIMNRPGEINLDLGSLRRVFRQRGGKTLYGLGSGSGDRSAELAFKDLLMCPLLHSPEFSSRADHLLINITAGPELAMNDVHETVNRIKERFGRDGNLAMGLVLDEAESGGVEICVLGTTEVDRQPAGADRHRRQWANTASRKPGSGKSAGESQGVAGRPPKPMPVVKPHQREFGFEEEDKRGLFDRSESNVYEGEDLDVPTYLRRGIRISP